MVVAMIQKRSHLTQVGTLEDREQILRRSVQSFTHRQIRGLEISCNGSDVVVSGRCQTYYTKQLVTQAIKTTEPLLQLHNEIKVG